MNYEIEYLFKCVDCKRYTEGLIKSRDLDIIKLTNEIKIEENEMLGLEYILIDKKTCGCVNNNNETN